MTPQRIVVKLGTSTLTAGTRRLNRAHMLAIVGQMARLKQQGHELILVSSGAQAAGRERLGFPQLDKSLPAKQMLSAIGQSRLMSIYSDLFDIYEIVVAQVLLTRDDLNDRLRYLNARDTLVTLIEQGVLPIINENDTVATEEIRVGDNDNLSAMVASTLEADWLIILTDQQGLYTADPRRDPQARLISEVAHIDDRILALAGGVGSAVGTGGMATKLQAAQVATRSGVTTVIANGALPDVLLRLLDGESLGTRFLPTSTHLEGRKRWLLTGKPQGQLLIDAGAVRALQARDGASLLPIGLLEVRGDFQRGAEVAICGPDGAEIGRGLVAYDSDALRLLCRQHSARIHDILGYSYGDEAVHRNNFVLLKPSL
ncbi:MAG: glutamate 5-kinase [Anaerolineae bacterium]|nr:glutamate 5-kinase [Anaerolineae bacterium]MDW8172933.1 glutamate 5-kinase [Anaerolineae bacterium]